MVILESFCCSILSGTKKKVMSNGKASIFQNQRHACPLVVCGIAAQRYSSMSREEPCYSTSVQLLYSKTRSAIKQSIISHIGNGSCKYGIHDTNLISRFFKPLIVQKNSVNYLPFVKNIWSFQYSSSVKNFKSFCRSFNKSCLSNIHCKLEKSKGTRA